eukprot:scaffold40617_cov35-Attheya_sp.AAC.1
MGGGLELLILGIGRVGSISIFLCFHFVHSFIKAHVQAVFATRVVTGELVGQSIEHFGILGFFDSIFYESRLLQQCTSTGGRSSRMIAKGE